VIVQPHPKYKNSLEINDFHFNKNGSNEGAVLSKNSKNRVINNAFY
jgi:hypothetical protein